MYRLSFYVVEYMYTSTAQCLLMFMLTERNTVTHFSVIHFLKVILLKLLFTKAYTKENKKLLIARIPCYLWNVLVIQCAYLVCAYYAHFS
jgi:hypothetical protein